MKLMHREDLFSWSSFDVERNVDFNGFLWAREGQPNVAFDPMPLSATDADQVDRLGGIDWVLLTNADHVRATRDVVARWEARVAAPTGDRERPELRGLPIAVWLGDDEGLTFDVRTIAMRGSKTDGELAFVLDAGDTVICGDLVRGQRAGRLNLLPDPKLQDREAAIASVARLAELPVRAVLVGDGQSVFHDGRARLMELLERLEAP